MQFPIMPLQSVELRSVVLSVRRAELSSNSPDGVGDEDSSRVQDIVADGEGAVAELVGVVAYTRSDGANEERSGQSNVATAGGDANQSLLKGSWGGVSSG
jgi:hypothetical protein